MTLSSTSLAMTGVRTFANVRCRGCKRLLLKWEFAGEAYIEVKCPRCGSMEMVHLSTG